MSGWSTRTVRIATSSASLDNRQGEPGWSSDGRWVYFTVQERGEVHLYRIPASGGEAGGGSERSRKRGFLVGEGRPARVCVIDTRR